ncbi:MAG: hypothetical protein P4L22_05795 [Candidatus Babeliales bacterium]|nr:hypothetical protein [Candidatus Babeliales bacterium]
MNIFLSFVFLTAIIYFLIKMYRYGITKCKQQKLGLTNHNSSQAYMPTYQKEKEAYYANIQKKAWGTITTAYIKLLAEEEKSLHQIFFELTQTNQSILDQFKKKYSKEKSTIYKEIDDEHSQYEVSSNMKSKVTDLLKEYCINTNNINVMIVTNDSIDSLAQASGTTIFISQSLVHNNNDIELSALAKTIILHELQHILHEDDLNNDTLANICVENPSTEKHELAYSQAMKIKTFQEKRADILAMLAHHEYAQATAHSFKTADGQKIEEAIKRMHAQGASKKDMLSTLEELFEKFNFDSDDFLMAELTAHPSPTDRYFYSKLLHKEMSTLKKESIIDGILHDIVKAK